MKSINVKELGIVVTGSNPHVSANLKIKKEPSISLLPEELFSFIPPKASEYCVVAGRMLFGDVLMK